MSEDTRTDYEKYVSAAKAEALATDAPVMSAYEREHHMRMAEFWVRLAQAEAVHNLSNGFLPAEIFVDTVPTGTGRQRWRAMFRRR